MSVFITFLKVRYAGLFVLISTLWLFPFLSLNAETFEHALKTSVRLDNALFVESKENRALNEETGNLIYYSLGYFKQFNNNVFLDIRLEESRNDLDYDGFSQGGLRFQTTTEYFIRSYKAIIGRKALSFSSYVGLNSRYRERNILTTENFVEGLYEEFTSNELLVGFDFYFWQSNNGHLRLVNQLSAGFNSEMHVEFNSAYDSTNFPAGDLVGINFGVEYFYGLNNRFGIFIFPSYKYTHINRSKKQRLSQGGETVDGVVFNQPTTEFQELSLEVGVSLKL